MQLLAVMPACYAADFNSGCNASTSARVASGRASIPCRTCVRSSPIFNRINCSRMNCRDVNPPRFSSPKKRDHQRNLAATF